MASIKLKLIQEDEAYINFHVNLDPRGSTGYESTVSLYNKDGAGWTAEMTFDDMPVQETPGEAIDRMGLYLRQMATAMKGKNIKHLNIDNLFQTVYKR